MDDGKTARIAIVVPQVGEAIAEARLVEWQVDEGDPIVNGTVLFIVDTEKAEVEVEAFVDGVISEILVGADSPVMPGQRVGTMLVERSKVPLHAGTDGKADPIPDDARPTTGSREGSARSGGPVRGASPLARRRARELDIDIAEVLSAVDGTVSADDVEAFSRNRAAKSSRPHRFGRLQRAVARATTVSKQNVPHFYLDMAVDMTAVICHRRESAPRHSVTSYVVAACVLALTEHPDLNVSFDESGLVKREEVSVGVAVATDQGLLVPVLSDLVGVGLSDIGDRLRQAAERARLGRLTSADHGLRSMVVTNLGMFGVDRFHAIINQPDPFILAVGKTGEQVVAIDGEITIRPTAVLSLSADHRVVDGVTAARFLSSVAAHLEELEGRVWS